MLWQRFRTRTLKCLYPLDILHVGALGSTPYPARPTQIAVVSEKANFFGAVPASDLPAIRDGFIEHPDGQRDLLDRLIIEFKQKSTSFRAASTRLVTVSKSQSTFEYGSALHAFNEHYLDCSSLTWIGIALYPALLEPLLNDILKRHGVADEERPEYMTVLTTPEQRSFMLSEEENLIDIAQQVLQDKTALAAFHISDSIDEHALRVNFPWLHELLTKHHESYCWVPFDYTGPAWTMVDIIKRVQELLTQDLSAKLRHINEYIPSVRHKKIEALSSLQPTASEHCLLQSFESVMLLQDIRKETFTYAHYCVTEILTSIARTLGVDLGMLRYATAHELQDICDGRFSVSTETLLKRMSLWTGRCTEGQFNLLDDKSARRFVISLGMQITDHTDSINGMIARIGKVTAPARIIIDEANLHEMRVGEVLVTKMTTPTYVLAMHKAAAIVTDEGGITSHAAIVSRELGIPCIVGTQVASSIFATGDMLEVDAYSGLVRRVDETLLSRRLATEITSRSSTRASRRSASESFTDAPNTIPLESIRPEHEHLVGSKAFSLARLRHACSVPNAFCITTEAFRRVLAHANAQSEIQSIIESVVMDISG